MVSDRCDTLLEQIKRYRWAAPSRSEDEPRERPVKRDDHLLDALRYVVMSNPTPPEAPITGSMSRMDRIIREDLEGFERGDGANQHPQGTGVFL
jgi:hypothetical protein